VRKFRPVPFDTTSLSDPWANGLAPDGEGGFWVTTESGGLNRYDPVRDDFQRFPSAVPLRVNSVVQDDGGVLWIGATYEGLFRFDPSTGRSDRFAADPGDPAALPFHCIETLLLDDRPLNNDMTFVVLTLREDGWAEGVAHSSTASPACMLR
jgi:ligand-binding sensor domain-containing protein